MRLWPLLLAACTQAPFDPDNPGEPPVVCVNELMASNKQAYDVNGTSPDWVELHNPTGEAVDLSGWWVSDNPDNLDKHTLPEGVSVPAQGYLVLTADAAVDGGATSLPFKLAKEGESLWLTDLDGRTDGTRYVAMPEDFALARIPDCCTDSACWRLLPDGTPGAMNVE